MHFVQGGAKECSLLNGGRRVQHVAKGTAKIDGIVMGGGLGVCGNQRGVRWLGRINPGKPGGLGPRWGEAGSVSIALEGPGSYRAPLQFPAKLAAFNDSLPRWLLRAVQVQAGEPLQSTDVRRWTLPCVDESPGRYQGKVPPGHVTNAMLHTQQILSTRGNLKAQRCRNDIGTPRGILLIFKVRCTRPRIGGGPEKS